LFEMIKTNDDDVIDVLSSWMTNRSLEEMRT
jgi:hypothetical protein